MNISEFVDNVILNDSIFSANALIDITMGTKEDKEVTFKVDASFGADEADPRTGVRMLRVMFGFGHENVLMHSTYYVTRNQSYRGDYISALEKHCQFLIKAVETTKNKNVMNFYRDETDKALGAAYQP
jgi:hypothetical protein|tara:strand:- start:101 stop:484 length:384 start_codon:yes stop_codon:yes gene_type:complete